MSDFKSLLKPGFRRSNTSSSAKSDLSTPSASNPAGGEHSSRNRGSLRLSKNKRLSSIASVQEEKALPALPTLNHINRPRGQAEAQSTPRPNQGKEPRQITPVEKIQPKLVVEEASPQPQRRGDTTSKSQSKPAERPDRLRESDARPSLATRRHSPISFDQSRGFPFVPNDESSRSPQRSPPSRTRPQTYNRMPSRKVWVKRPNAVATQVPIGEDDLVDDVKDMILRKYANSLGRNFDPPDVNLKLVLGPHSSRHTNERNLGPDENILKILDMHFTGGQSMDEALLIDVPRKTPKHSPRVAMPYYLQDDLRPAETGTDYFPPMPAAGPQSPHLSSNLSLSGTHVNSQRPPAHAHPHSIAILETGHVPNLPSPGAGNRTRHSDRPTRPRHVRQHTSSPTVISSVPHSQAHDPHNAPSKSNPASTPPVPEAPHRTATPPPRVDSPRPTQKTRRSKKSPLNGNSAHQIHGLLDGSVPPINCLIVEDNIINLRLLEAFLKRLKVRWSTAMNGEIAVNKWREGGFHLVLMDIQLPVMNGLDATKEIRRLERVNKIGVFANNAARSTPEFEKGVDDSLIGTSMDGADDEETSKEPKQEDNLKNMSLFKSPVIIVALTASSLQSDRHAALAAGCNDFLTKPVNFDWLSRKVMEWGCMQALIDFDGWRKWKDISNQKAATGDDKTSKKAVNGRVSSGEKVKSPLMNGKHKKFLGITDGGNSSGGEGAGGSSGGEGG
ncbi:uncharacterized protein KY384_000504 [Bacidia gigantensis]|uniref:uncharacterized protein n=1 Tax=Bacidia gigantensis TaxID=2732470 RepID=UPI001D046D49|nr:uncharacterized protein KY384_000504 [Bacidia gigantensis]KAG8525744.1 hypothetical protein KY384_000504 [Bacidia gigantensis]